MFKNKSNLLNEKGFTLPELLIGLVLTSIIMIGFTTGIAQVVKLTSSNQNKEVSVREVDTVGTWFVRDFLSASVVPSSVDLTPNNGKNIIITQSVAGQNGDTNIVYSVDDSGNLLRQTTPPNGPTTSLVIGTGVTLVHYVVSSNSVNQINITSAGPNSVPITKTYNVETRIYNSGLFIINSYLPDAFVGINYRQVLEAIGGKEPFTWTFTPNVTDDFPAWAHLDPSGLISGTPSSVADPVDFSLMVTDAAGATADRSFSIKVVQPLVVSTASLPSGESGLAYSGTLTATGGALPYFWYLDSGSGPVPDGTTLDLNGTISGTPTQIGTFPVIVDVLDSDGNSANSLSNNLQINIGAGPSITTASLPNGTAGVSYGNQTLGCNSGVTPYTWSFSGNPPGLTVNATTGVITGTPTTAGTYNCTVKVTDSVGGASSKSFTITIYTQLNINTNSLPNGNPGILYSQTLACSGGLGPYTWSISPMPSWLALNATTGITSGTPTTANTYSFTVTVTDSASHQATKSLSIVINGPTSITTGSPLPNGRTDQTYSQTIVATGGQSPYNWTWSGSTPGGLILTGSTGIISGTPAKAGTYTFSVTVTDSLGSHASQNFTITVVTPPAVTTVSATGVGSGSATLNGNLTSLGSAHNVYVYFEWGTDPNYGTYASTSQTAKGTTGTFSASITGLTKNQTYHFRVVAVGDVTIYGSDVAFKAK